MRTLFFAAAIAVIAAPIAAAETVAGFVNQSGGMTVITERQQYCGARQMFDGYAFSADGRTVRMCWLVAGQTVRAVFDDGDVYAYPVSVFEVLEKEPEVQFNQP